MSAEPHISPETLAAEAKRRRTFRRWVISIPCVVLAFVVLRVVWGSIASHRLQAEIDRIRAAGEPVFASEFPVPRGLPAEKNAADCYHSAFAAIDKRGHGKLTFNNATGYHRAFEKYPEDVEAIVLANQKVVDIVRQARAMPETDWAVHVTTPLIDTNVDFLSEARRVTSVLSMAARFRQRHHKDAEALDIVNDIFLLADRLPQTDSYCPMVSVLTAISLHYQGCSVLEVMAPSMPIGDHSSGDTAETIPREQIVRLIQRLLDDDSLWKAYSKAMGVERATDVDAVEHILRSAVVTAADVCVIVFVKPAWQLDTIHVSRHIEGARRVGMSANWSRVVQYPQFARPDPSRNSLQEFAHYPSYMFGSSMRRPTKLLYRTFAERHMTAIALAIRLFEIDHGHRPSALAELVPDYLDAVPVDPFAKDAGPIRYLPDASPPRLYSVNANQIDNHGLYPTPGGKGVNIEDCDAVYFLNGDRPYPEVPEN